MSYLITAAPKSLAWRGYVNNNWDTTTKNWLDLNTGTANELCHPGSRLV